MSETNNSEFKPANDNPWYLLATLYGEQNGETTDEELANRNRIAWNRWFAEALNEDNREYLLKNGFSKHEVTPFTNDEKNKFEHAFASRSGKILSLPNAKEAINFSYTIFECRVYFDGYLFANVANFERAKFIRTANFYSANFSLFYADFREARFASDVTFDDSKFCMVNFDSSVFSGHARFRSTTFFTSSFNSATFYSVGDFESATFNGSARFMKATFYIPHFRSATFCLDATFSNTTFSFNADFKSATFSGYANFDSTIFSHDADFNSAIFSEIANFESATFSNKAYFSSTKFQGNANFKSAIFSGDVNFINSEFTYKTIFSNVRFESNVPDFRGAKLHDATEWHGVVWPYIRHDTEGNQKQVYAYERLKQEMERLKKHEDEQFFFRKELRVRRELLSRASFARWLNSSYEVLSDYGYSIVRPLLWMVAIFLLGSVIFWLMSGDTDNPEMLSQAASFSFSSIFSIFPIAGKIMTSEQFTYLSTTAKFVAVTQSIFGALLFFLLSLALRNRFRMK